MRVCLIGCGRVARHYAYLKNENLLEFVDFVSCFDVLTNKTDELTNLLGSRKITNRQELFEQKNIDFALILTPSGDHFRTALDFLEHGFSVIVEKPITLIPSQIDLLSRKAEANGLSIFSILQNRFNPAVQKFRSLLDSGSVGRVLVGGLRLRWGRNTQYYEDGWHGTWLMDGGVTSQQAIHHIFALDQLFGPITELSAMSSNRRFQIEGEDTLIGLARTASGSMFTIEVTTTSYQGDYEGTISLLTEKGVYELGGLSLNRLTLLNNPSGEVQVILEQSIPNGYGFGHVEELRRIERVLGCSSGPIVDLGDSKRALLLVHSLYKSVELGGSIVKVADNVESRRLGV